MKQLLSVGLILFLMATFAFGAEENFEDSASEVLMETIPKGADKELKALYGQLAYMPVWVDSGGINHLGKELLTLVLNEVILDEESSLKKEAKLIAVEYDMQNLDFSQKLLVETRLSRLYLNYAKLRLFGSINWGAFLARLWNIKTKDIHADWKLYRSTQDPQTLLEQAVLGKNLSRAFEEALPESSMIAALKKRLVYMRGVKKLGGWGKIAGSKILKPNMSDPLIVQIKRRLALTDGYYYLPGKNDSLYDAKLKEAVVAFQKRHGLVAKGVIGPETLRHLNEPVESKIDKIKLNIDRLKWVRSLHGGKHIHINIPEFMLHFTEQGHLIKEMAVVVGKKDHPTPIFGDELETVVLNPYWNIPKRIIQNEMIPKLLRNPYSLRRKGIEIYRGWGKDAKPINPASVNWANYRYAKRVPFRFAQLPGKKNALGKIKFLFPNSFSVYMHDTPAKSLFSRNRRAFSHGCVRLSQPYGMLEAVASVDSSINMKKSDLILKGKKKSYFSLKEKIPVDITYLTAWVDSKGILQFRDDVYGYDEMQLKAYRRW